MAKSNVVDKNANFNKIIQELEKVAGSYVKVGFLSNQITHAQVQIDSNTGNQRIKKAGLSIAEIARANEYGTKTIPARSFMRSTYDENLPRLNRIIGKEYDKILAGKSTVKRSLDAVGLYMQGLIQQKIRAIRSPPNAPSTIKRKGSSKPLIDFGQMISAVTHEVVIV